MRIAQVIHPHPHPPHPHPRLNENEIAHAREQRITEIQMWAIICEFITYFVFALLVFLITYSNREQNSYFQTKHLQTFFFNTRQTNVDYSQVCFSLGIAFNL